ncbi:hypothetical protein ACERK3_02455 [Phycisphaerales bacterium AB-hyl4]|uniref:DUF998 domain-containing protein n=1 Tax=Natronomicrosphaera hydrolytica TaxID=3242702 RepID=A0ABV4U0L4_9BACT
MPHETRLASAIAHTQPWHILLAIGGFLAVGWGLFFFVDVLNLGGSRDWLAGTGLGRPMTWAQLFRECGPAEWLQWLCLGIGAVAMGAAGTRWLYLRPKLAAFWFVLGAGLVLLLIEDAGNPRHQIRRYVLNFTGSDMLQKAAEFAFFCFLAVAPLYATVRFGNQIWPFRRTRRYILLGYFAYAVASLSSATRHWGDWHAHVGEWLYVALNLPFAVEMGGTSRGFWLMDKIVEESIELTAAAMLLAAIVAFHHESRIYLADRDEFTATPPA